MIFDVAIIGGGPAGIFSVVANGMLSLSCAIFEASDRLGGQCSNIYPEKFIYDIPAFPRITGAELTANLAAQASKFNPEIHLNSFVKNLEFRDGFFELSVEKISTNGKVEEKFFAKCILLALGNGIFRPIKPLLEGLEKYENKNIFYFLDNLSIFEGKRVAIAGGGDSAVDWALMLAKMAEKVYLIHRREFIKAHPSSWKEVLEISNSTKKIEVKIPYQITKINENAGEFTGLTISTDAGEEEINCDFFLPCFGLKSDLNFLESWKIALENGKIRVDSGTMKTSEPGIYAIGDCVDYLKRRRLILTGFSEAFQAAHDVYSYINPQKPPIIGHSTSLMDPCKK